MTEDELHHDPAFLSVAYHGREQTIGGIAFVCDVSVATVLYHMRKNDIPRRPQTNEIPDEELQNDLREVADALGEIPSSLTYQEHGEHSPTTIQERYGGWASALKEAGIFERHSQRAGK